ncbi:hypothetical protein FB45DRAFT_929561 [Roridomyces roridus]|uniref:Uncharacterized protein n=1 Tax=Roridomyces roridus TaxID=1738132 RepID=A0AAD7FH96_9AGAR|nr:hypothetical protein FB45DRAFT_929561 [Roridomyces roridus]
MAVIHRLVHSCYSFGAAAIILSPTPTPIISPSSSPHPWRSSFHARQVSTSPPSAHHCLRRIEDRPVYQNGQTRRAEPQAWCLPVARFPPINQVKLPEYQLQAHFVLTPDSSPTATILGICLPSPPSHCTHPFYFPQLGACRPFPYGCWVVGHLTP